MATWPLPCASGYLAKVTRSLPSTGFFGRDKFLGLNDAGRLTLVQGDIRSIENLCSKESIVSFDLPGLSNDATSDINPALTQDIGFGGGIRSLVN